MISLKINIKIIRILILIFVCLVLVIAGTNFYNTVRTPFSGTTYLPLPSNFYIFDDLSIPMPDGTDSTDNRIFIPRGSFLISVNGIFLDSLFSEKDSLKAISKMSDLIGNSSDTLNLGYLTRSNNNYMAEIISQHYYRSFIKSVKISRELADKLPVNFLPDGILLGYIEKNGATYSAGIQSGDILIAVNGEPWKVIFSELEQSYRLDDKSMKALRSNPIGEPIYYNILRDGRIKSFEVRLAAFGVPINLLLGLILGILFVTFGSFFAFKNTIHKGSLLTGIWMILMGANMSLSIMISSTEVNLFHAIMVFLKTLIPVVYIPILLYSFACFPIENKKFTSSKWAIYSFFSIYILLAVGIFTDFIFKYFIINDKLYFTLLILGILYWGILSFKFKKYEDPANKSLGIKQYLVFLIIFITLDSSSIFTLLGINYDSVIWQYSFLLFAIIPVFYLFILKKYNLINTIFRFRRSTQYNFITIMWHFALILSSISIIYYLSQLSINLPLVKLSGANIEFMSPTEDYAQNSSSIKIIFAAISILIAIMAIKFGGIGQDYLNRKFYRQQFDYKKVQNELAYLMQSKFNLSDLAVLIVEKIKDLVHLKNIGIIFFKNEENLNEENIFCYENNSKKEICLMIDNQIFELLKEKSDAIDINKMPEHIKQNFKNRDYKYIFPLKIKNTLYGALLIGENLSETEMKRDDFEFLYSMSTSFAIAIENTMLYEELAQKERLKHELDIARRIQLGSLPQSVPIIDGLDLSAFSIPAFEVGGDFYDYYIGIDNTLTLVVGDVSGKGTSAALYMSKIQGILRTLNEFNLSPFELLKRTNRLIYKNIESTSYVTALAASFNTLKHQLILTRGGHLPLIKFNKLDNTFSLIKPKGIGLGLANDKVFNDLGEEIIINYTSGDFFIFLTDGVTESRNPSGEEFGFQRFENMLFENDFTTSKDLLELIQNSLQNYSKGKQPFDDLTAVIIKITN